MGSKYQYRIRCPAIRKKALPELPPTIANGGTHSFCLLTAKSFSAELIWVISAAIGQRGCPGSWWCSTSSSSGLMLPVMDIEGLAILLGGG